MVIDTPLTEEMRRAEGVTLADGTALSPGRGGSPDPGRPDRESQAQAGVYHQIKRMFGVYGAGVNALAPMPSAFALTRLLAPGQWRAFCGGSDSNYHRSLTAFHLIFKKTSHFAGKIFTRTTQNSAFWA